MTITELIEELFKSYKEFGECDIKEISLNDEYFYITYINPEKPFGDLEEIPAKSVTTVIKLNKNDNN